MDTLYQAILFVSFWLLAGFLTFVVDALIIRFTKRKFQADGEYTVFLFIGWPLVWLVCTLLIVWFALLYLFAPLSLRLISLHRRISGYKED